MDDGIVMSLDVHGNNPTLMWAQFGADYNTITPAQRSSARTYFLMFRIGNDESYIDIKLRYDELLRKVTVQGGMIGDNDRLQTLLGALPEKIDLLREAYFTKDLALGIQFLWDRMYDIESTERKRALQAGASGMAAEVYYQSARGRGNFRGRGRRGSYGGRGAGGETKKRPRIVSGAENLIIGVRSAPKRTASAHGAAEWDTSSRRAVVLYYIVYGSYV